MLVIFFNQKLTYFIDYILTNLQIFVQFRIFVNEIKHTKWFISLSLNIITTVLLDTFMYYGHPTLGIFYYALRSRPHYANKMLVEVQRVQWKRDVEFWDAPKEIVYVN